MKTEKTYRISGSEHFNLMSMYDKLKCMEIDMEEGTIPWDDSVEKRLEEVTELLDKAPFVGALVSWEDLKRIREIKDERQFMRYQKSFEEGASEQEAAISFDL